MKKQAKWLALSVALVSSAHGYEVLTHARLSGYAAQQSVLNDAAAEVLQVLCSADGVDDKRCVLPSASPYPNTLTPRRLIEEGAIREDEGDRSANHFFDPQHEGRPLTYGMELGENSPDWALEDVVSVDGQETSFTDARMSLYMALTGPTEATRRHALGATFESLGHVIHHVQDMAQPQHARNDAHCDRFFSVFFAPLPFPGVCTITLAFRPSAYESYTRSRGYDIPHAGYEAVDYGTFQVPRDFWYGAGLGIAEFTSLNFVSAGTNFRLVDGQAAANPEYPAPGSATALYKRQITDADLLGPQGPTQPLSGELWFASSLVADSYDTSKGAINQRASTYSLFASDLRSLAGQPRVPGFFALNRFNHAAANDFLLPRAAAYSTGLINYFFRGRIGIALPEQGVYGIVDHATTYAAGQGFGKIKLRLHNDSPDGVKPSGERVAQTMQGGTLVAVAKYTLNSCYLPDLTGDYAVEIDTGTVVPPAGCSVNQYFAGEEQISQSAAQLAVTLDKAPAEFTFDFSSQPIPINARDLRIQVVYTGPLGAEADGIAFGGRDISEPTHLVVYNNSDWFAVDGKFYTPQQIQSDPALKQRVGSLNIDPRPLSSVALVVVPNKPLTGEAVGVPVNGYVRVAVLADVDQPFSLSVLTRFEGGAFSASTFGGIWANTTDLRGEPAYITPLAIYRGPRAHFVDVVFKANNSTPLLDDELVTMSTRTAADPGPTQIPLRF